MKNEFFSIELEQLKNFTVKIPKEDDFDTFWQGHCSEMRKKPFNSEKKSTVLPYSVCSCTEIWIDAFDQTRLHGIVIVPNDHIGSERLADGKRPVVISYHGYTGTSGGVNDYLPYILLGYVVVAFDARGQAGGSYDRGIYHSGGEHVMTKGCHDPSEYYLTKLYLDGVRQIDYAKTLACVDAEKVIVMGGSQGGGTSLAVSALDSSVKYCFADVPSYCWIKKRIETGAGGFSELAEYIRRNPGEGSAICKTITYVDNINLADRIKATTYMSVGYKDPVCPIQNSFAAYNKITAEKHVMIYEFAQHEGGSGDYFGKKIDILATLF